MPRKPRFNLPGIPQHIIQRGNNRERCFLFEQDYQRYLSDLKQASEKYYCHIHAYVLMTNHVHLLITPLKEHAISEMMQALGRRYVRYFNNIYQRSGTLWEGRYRSSLVDSESYLFQCMQYIEMNPIRAGLVEHPGEYRWSSYQTNAHARENILITPHALFMAMASNEDERCFCYRELFRIHFDDALLRDIRDALNHELVLGHSNFKNRIAQLSKRQLKYGQPGRPRVGEDQISYFVC